MKVSVSSPLRAQIFQHVPFEGPGQLGPWLEQAGAILSTTRWFAGDAPPDSQDADCLLILGGPMSVLDEATHPWLVEEKACIRRFIATGKPVLGICLGAQLIAHVLGAQVYPNPEPEIGWFPIEGIPQTDRAAFQFPPSAPAFHWHGETVDLPDGAQLLARSAACEHQAFQVGASILGLQFHLETTPESAQALVTHAGNDLIQAPFVQTKAELLGPPPGTYADLHRLMDRLMDYLLPAE
jgi:GMP synthase-like glutamine amidotransferase